VGDLRRRLSLVLSVLSLIGGCGRRRITLAEVDRRVTDAVPVGAGHARVLAILDSLEIDHGDFIKETRTIVATVRESPNSGIVTRTYRFKFLFDSAGKLVSHTVETLFTGP
jgi:hypothetical protein